MNAFLKYSLLVLTCLNLWACKSKELYTTRPTKSSNNPENDLLELNVVAYHLNDSVTTVHLEIKNENLLYKRPDTTLAFFAELRIFYKLLAEPNSRKILDSSSFYVYDRVEGEQVKMKSLLSQFNLKAKTGNYYLELEAFDVNRRTKYTSSLNIYKQSVYSDQNFLVTLRDTVAFKNNFLKDERVLIKFSSSAIKQVTVDCFLKESGPAAPPFSTRKEEETKYKPDSVFNLNLSTNQFMLTMPSKGFYHVRADQKSKEGLTLFTYDKTFPGVSNSEEMINCTRYIMNQGEFESCKESPEKKAAIDKFWLTLGGSNERARELLKRYYGRVKEANKYYSSYVEGWKTDRGMVFIVFGPPGNIYKSKHDEIWVYGNEANPGTLRFIFNKVQNPLSDNDYMLERSQFYRDAYYTAVDYWREGNIYIDNRK